MAPDKNTVAIKIIALGDSVLLRADTAGSPKRKIVFYPVAIVQLCLVCVDYFLDELEE